jgi:pyruvyltransferase
VLKLDININFIDMAQNMKYNKSLKTFSFLGSIVHQLPDHVDVIGSGINPNYPIIKPTLNILALRGELSKNFLNKNTDYTLENIVYGDPALLIPRLFPEWLKKTNNNNSNNNTELIIGFIPHYNDMPHIEEIIKNFNDRNIKICYPNQDAIKVINFIKECDIMISSSLHGIIVSEMLQKDTKWLMFEHSLKSETEFKYLDYYTSTNRINIKYAKNLVDALEMKIPPPEYNDTDLFNLLINYLSC